MMSVHCRSVIDHPWIKSHLYARSSLQTETEKSPLVYSILLTLKYPAPFLKSDYMLALVVR